MKRICTLLILCACFQTSNAQYTLTQSSTEPAHGDVYTLKLYNGNGPTTPTNTGTNQTWDFSGFTPLNIPDYVMTFQNSNQNGATLSSNHSDQSSALYISTPGQFEMFNEWEPNNSQFTDWAYSDPKILYKWPFSPGSVSVDSFAMSRSNSSTTVTIKGAREVYGMSMGNLILPGGPEYKAFQVLIVETSTASTNGVPALPANTVTIYQYFHSVSKFPLLEYRLDSDLGPSLKVNKSVSVGISETGSLKTVSSYPNPVKERLHVFAGDLIENSQYRIISTDGKLMKEEQILKDPGSNEIFIETNSLPAGIYHIEIRSGTRILNGRFVKED